MDRKPDGPPLRAVAKYFLLQLPGQVFFVLILVLFRKWVEFPADWMWALIGFWVGKDVILFPFLWRYYDPDLHPDRFQMVGRRGFALTRLNPDGYVQLQAERWRACIAEGEAPIEKGEEICVDSVIGLTLTVRKPAPHSE